MTNFTTTAIAAAIIGSVSLASGAALAMVPSPTSAVTAPGAGPTWVKMMKKKKMMHKKGMMKKRGMMKKKMM